MEVIYIFDPTLKGLLIGWITSLFTAYFIQWLKDRRDKQHYNKVKAAYAVLFQNLIACYDFHVKYKVHKPWENKLWDASQAKLAEFFPEETAIFAFLILESRTISELHPKISYSKLHDSLQELNKTLDKAQSKSTQ